MDVGLTHMYEELFAQTMEEIIPVLDGMNIAPDTIIGIPFYNEKESLLKILQMIASHRQEAALRQSMVICCGDPSGGEIAEAIREMNLPFPHFAFVMKPGAEGRGASIRALMEIAQRLETDLIIMAADLQMKENQGLNFGWIEQLIQPIKNEYDLALVNFRRHHLECLVGDFLTSQLLEVFYGAYVTDPHSGIYGFSHDLVEDLVQEIKLWPEITRGYGVDPWLITRALKWNKRVCEVELGAKLTHLSLEKVSFIFKETVASLFACILRDSRYWLDQAPVLRRLDIYGRVHYRDVPEEAFFSFADLIDSYKRNYSLFERVNQSLLSPETNDDLQANLDGALPFDQHLWAALIYSYLQGYAFNSGVSRNDQLNSLTHLFIGRIAYILDSLEKIKPRLSETMLNGPLFLQGAVAALRTEQSRIFTERREWFVSGWRAMEQQNRPPLTPAHFMEFIPGAPLVLPKKLTGLGRNDVYVEEIFSRTQNQYREKFDNLVHGRLNIPHNACSEDVARGIADFMEHLEETLSRLLPGDLYYEEGIRSVLKELFAMLPDRRMFSVKDELLRELLIKLPPTNVMIPLGCSNSRSLLDKIEVRDTFSLVSLIEDHNYLEKADAWIMENLDAGMMEEVEIKPLILGAQTDYAPYHLMATGTVNKLATRVVVSPTSKGMGGKYPYTHFYLNVAYQIAATANLSRLWRTYSRERKNLGKKVMNSLLGWYQAGAFSVNNIFENGHHRLMVNTIKNMGNSLAAAGKTKENEIIQLMVESYGLSQVLENEVFLPCSAWTWSNFSYRGGEGVPSPLSAYVEEKWFNHDLLKELYVSLGYDRHDLDQKVVQLIGEGRGDDDLLDIALGIVPEDVVAVQQQMVGTPPAVPLRRLPGNPLLRPIPEHYWESKYVLNAAAVRLGEYVYILYRAFGDDEISRIGLAVTDGYQVLERLPDPVFFPQNETEKRGCEDPRVVVFDDELFMLYTAYDGVIAQIAAASIRIEDFENRRFDRWVRKGLAFPGIWNKDAIIFPEKFGNRYALYHRIEPSIWLTYHDKLEFPAPREQHAVILGPRSGRMWDSLKIGAGAQPIKTRYGWLMIYHGVDRELVYRLGVILLDLNNPARMLYRSPNPILSPETEYEVGLPGQTWVPNVVFTCGAVATNNKEILDADDELIVYYGAADAYLCAAVGRIGDLIPEEIRTQLEK